VYVSDLVKQLPPFLTTDYQVAPETQTQNLEITGVPESPIEASPSSPSWCINFMLHTHPNRPQDLNAHPLSLHHQLPQPKYKRRHDIVCLSAYIPSSVNYHSALRVYCKLLTIPVLRLFGNRILDYGTLLVVVTVSARCAIRWRLNGNETSFALENEISALHKYAYNGLLQP
jgi:hypothetical protein